MNENVYFECRKRAAIHNERLNSRAGAAEILGISESTLAHYELGITKNIPVDVVVMMAEVYNAPELKCIYCKSECPIGKELPIATEAGNIEGITVRMLSGLEDEKIDKIQKTLLRIAEDGKVEAAEREELKEMVQSLDGSMMYDTMSVEEIENVRNTYSKAKDSQAWKSSTGEMYKKTVLRRLCKLIDLDFDNIEQQKAYLAGGDVEFENGQPVFIDGRTATAALPDNGAPVDVFAQMEQAKKEPVPVEQSQPQETKEPTQQAIPFEQQQEEQPQPMPDGTGFMMPDESAMDDLPWK